ncbi:MAG TPA: hypothetical protein PLE75_00215 [Ferruginibacter sp.]|nr:hypothetical protein [Ferruginibacter sp.]HRO05077.1 hypothetical protein [Ferruginibacter sp.]HRO95618.1 hypothetical protein [Ferruginibacter sp.]HRP49523.1 hypothetical protein [Ferruginibacter sp.]
MKKIIFIVVVLMLRVGYSNAQPPVTDTLQWLRTNIEQRQHLFVNKPLKVMFDSLYHLKNGILQYISPRAKGWSKPDTIWQKKLVLYFGERWGGGAVSQSHMSNPGINTHVPVIVVEFSWPVAFLRKWYSADPDGLGSTDWNRQLEAFWSQQWVRSITIKEF